MVNKEAKHQAKNRKKKNIETTKDKLLLRNLRSCVYGVMCLCGHTSMSDLYLIIMTIVPNWSNYNYLRYHINQIEIKFSTIHIYIILMLVFYLHFFVVDSVVIATEKQAIYGS